MRGRGEHGAKRRRSFLHVKKAKTNRFKITHDPPHRMLFICLLTGCHTRSLSLYET